MLKIELLGSQAEPIDVEAASNYIADMQVTLDEISKIHLI